MLGALLAILLAIPARADLLPAGWKPVGPEKWGGLNILQDSTEIDGDAQQAQNVLTDSGYLEKRPGNVLLTSILPSSSPVQFVTDWVSAGGSRYLIAQASQTVYQTNFSGSPVAISTVPSGYNLSAQAAFSNLYFADGSKPLWYWNGTTSGTVTDAGSGTVAPTCTYLAYKDARLFCANLPSEGSSRVRISSQGGAGYWTVPSNVAYIDNAANVFDFTPNDGDQITCIAATPWGVFVGKRYSTYMIKGTGNLNYELRTIDPKIGCIDNRSVQMVYGVLHWLSTDGVYGYTGGGPPQLLTRELDPFFKQARESTYSEGQWATQLQSDWQTGTTSIPTQSLPPQSWDYTTSPGSVFPSSFTLYDDNSGAAQNRSGFYSDTLINIDTITYPFSTGLAQVTPSSAGIQVWISSFPAGNYTTTYTTWTADGIIATGNNFVSNGNDTSGTQNSTLYLYSMANSSGPTPSSNGWTYGSWTFQWACGVATGGGTTYGGGCNPSGISGTPAEFHFFANKPKDVDSSWSGYGLSISYPGSTPYTISLFKSVLGTKTSLGSYQFSAPATGSLGVALSTFTITRNASGLMTLIVNGANAISVSDTDSSITKNNVTTVVLSGTALPAATQVGRSVLSLARLNGYNSTGSIVSRIYDTGQSAPLAGSLSSSYTVPSGTELDFYFRASTSPNNDMWSSWQASSNSVVAVLPKRYWQYESLFYTNIASATPKLQSVQLIGITTGYYYSQVNFIGSLITSWKQFGITENNPGRYAYAVRQATYSFSPSATSPSWTAQTANQNVNLSVSTPTYVQFRLDSTGMANADLAEPISGVFLRWAQGANLPVASAALDRRYYLCVTISTSATAPDQCLIRQKNGRWVSWIGPSVGAMGMYNYNIVAADGTNSSKVWYIMQPGVYQDDGTPIDSIWVSADYTAGLVFNPKILHEIWIDAMPIQTSSITVSWQADKAYGWNDYQFSLDNGQGARSTINANYNAQYGSLNKFIPITDGYGVGKYFRLKFEDNTLNSYYRVNSYLMYVEPEGRQIP